MKKIMILFALFIHSFFSMKAQNVTINSVTTLPVTLTDTQHVKAVVSTMFSSGGCPLLNSASYLLNDTVYLIADYEVGLLAVICYSTDTFDLGILPCATIMLHVEANITVGGMATDESSIPMNINCTATGISEINSENDLIIFPNPVSNELSFIQNENLVSPLKVSILNVFGELIYFSIGTSKDHSTKLDVSILPNGIYFVRVESTQGVSINKLVKS